MIFKEFLTLKKNTCLNNILVLKNEGNIKLAFT